MKMFTTACLLSLAVLTPQRLPLRLIVASAGTPTVAIVALSPSPASIDDTAQSGTATVTASDVSSWSSGSSAGWLTIASGGSGGNGSATLTYDATANTGASSRFGVLTISASGATSATLTVTQAGVGAAGLIDASHIEYLGSFRMPTGTPTGFPSGVNTTFAYGGLAGRQVGGETHLFLYGANNQGCYAPISSGASTSIFTTNAGYGACFSNGQTIVVWRKFGSGNPIGEERVVSTVVGDVVTLTSALGGTPANGDVAYLSNDAVYEVVDPEAASCNTGSYNTAYNSSPRACAYANWGDVYHGHRVSWIDDGTPQDPSGQIPGALYYKADTNQLFWCQFQQYVAGSVYPCGFSTLDSVTSGVGTSTAYGPWKITATNGDNLATEGSQAGYLIQAKEDGTALFSGAYYQIDGYPGGPSLMTLSSTCATCDHGFPTTTTPSGYGQALDYSTRYLYKYYMGEGQASGHYFNGDGTLNGSVVRSWYTADASAAWTFEPLFGFFGTPNIKGDPSVVNVYSQTALTQHNGCVWLNLTNRRGVICAVSGPGSTGGNVADCTTGTHTWYANPGGGVMRVTSNASFSLSETVTGQTSNATAVLMSKATSSDGMSLGSLVGLFTVGETIHGGTSGANTTVTLFERGDKCYHGCDQAAVVTGDQANHYWAALNIYDPTDLSANAASCTAGSACSGADYLTQPTSFINVGNTYGVHTQDNPALNGGGANFKMGYFDPSRNYLFMLASFADDQGGDYRALIHVFHILDTAEPNPIRAMAPSSPTLLGWLWSLAPDLRHGLPTFPSSLFRRPA